MLSKGTKKRLDSRVALEVYDDHVKSYCKHRSRLTKCEVLLLTKEDAPSFVLDGDNQALEGVLLDINHNALDPVRLIGQLRRYFHRITLSYDSLTCVFHHSISFFPRGSALCTKVRKRGFTSRDDGATGLASDSFDDKAHSEAGGRDRADLDSAVWGEPLGQPADVHRCAR